MYEKNNHALLHVGNEYCGGIIKYPFPFAKLDICPSSVRIIDILFPKYLNKHSRLLKRRRLSSSRCVRRKKLIKLGKH